MIKANSKLFVIVFVDCVDPTMRYQTKSKRCLTTQVTWLAKYLPRRESGEVNIPKATIHRD